jgi:basic membrane protein A
VILVAVISAAGGYFAGQSQVPAGGMVTQTVTVTQTNVVTQVASQTVAAQIPLKPAFIYMGPVGDTGWTWNFDQARVKLEKEFGISIPYSESVPYADGPRVATEYISKGYNIIMFNDAMEVWNPDLSLVKNNPNVYFLHAAGYVHNMTNLVAFYGKMSDVRYLNGIVAGLMTKSGKIGYVAAHPIPEVITGLNAFTLGVRSVNPTATVHVAFTHSWYDPPTEKSVAQSLIAIGCDILTQHADSAAVQIAAEDAGIHSLGYQSDMTQFAPHAYLTGAIWNWYPILSAEFHKIQSGTFKNEWIYPGLESGVVSMGPYNPIVPQTVKDKVAAVQQAIMSGTFNVFAGPISDRDGNVRIPAGHIPTDDEIWTGMLWVVPGVVGDIPPATGL